MWKVFNVSDSGVDEALSQAFEFVHERLAALKLSADDQIRAELMCEESLMRLIDHSDFTETDSLTVRVSKSFGNVFIELAVPGQRFEFAESLQANLPVFEDITPADADVIANMYLRLFSPSLQYKHTRNFNVITIRAVRSAYTFLYQTLGALLMAAITGLVFREFLPESLTLAINENVFATVCEIFLDGMKMCTIPVVLFSVMERASNVDNLRGFRSAGEGLFMHFLLTQIVAVVLGFGLASLFNIGACTHIAFGLQSTHPEAMFSFRKMLADILPENVLEPIINGNTFQLVILGVLCGIAIEITEAKHLRGIVNEVNGVFMKITDMFMRFVTLMVFCSVASLIISSGAEAVMSALGILLTAFAGFALMNVIYFLMIRFSAGLNPLHMFKKSIPAMITSFSTCSTSAAFPDSLKAAQAMGISPRLYSFAIPIGATLNKNAFCLSLAVIVMSVVNMFSLHISAMQAVSLGMTIIIIAPGTSWAPIIALYTLFAQAGCPVEAIGIVMGIYTLLDMGDTVTCSNGTLTSTLIVARRKGMLNTEEYNKE